MNIKGINYSKVRSDEERGGLELIKRCYKELKITQKEAYVHAEEDNIICLGLNTTKMNRNTKNDQEWNIVQIYKIVRIGDAGEVEKNEFSQSLVKKQCMLIISC